MLLSLLHSRSVLVSARTAATGQARGGCYPRGHSRDVQGAALRLQLQPGDGQPARHQGPVHVHAAGNIINCSCPVSTLHIDNLTQVPLTPVFTPTLASRPPSPWQLPPPPPSTPVSGLAAPGQQLPFLQVITQPLFSVLKFRSQYSPHHEP